jgi:hypothetical protein
MNPTGRPDARRRVDVTGSGSRPYRELFRVLENGGIGRAPGDRHPSRWPSCRTRRGKRPCLAGAPRPSRSPCSGRHGSSRPWSASRSPHRKCENSRPLFCLRPFGPSLAESSVCASLRRARKAQRPRCDRRRARTRVVSRPKIKAEVGSGIGLGSGAVEELGRKLTSVPEAFTVATAKSG